MSELQFAKQFLNSLDNKATKYQPDHVFDQKTRELRLPYTLPRLSHPPHPTAQPYTAGTGTTQGSEGQDTIDDADAPKIKLHLSSPRNPSVSLTFTNTPITTPVATLKTHIATHLSLSDQSKIKILLNKKPIPSSKKTIADAFQGVSEVEGKDDVKLSVMVMGGAPDPATKTAEIDLSPVAANEAANEAAAIKASAPGSEKAAVEATTTKTNDSNPEAMQGVESNASTAPAWQEELSKKEFWDDLQGFLQQRLKSEEGAKKLRGVLEGGWRAQKVKIET